MPIDLTKLQNLKENSELEFKKASGKDGSGTVPESFWETYSAFANTSGGYIILGLREKSDKSLEITGIKDVNRVKKTLFDLINNPKKVSINLLNEDSIEILEINKKKILQIYIKKATRLQKPVYLGENPLKGTYLRRHEGDYLADEKTVKKMLSEQRQESLDSKILTGFDLDDLEKETLEAYRNVFSARSPNHPFLSFDLKEFLRAIGAFTKDRETKEEGLTLAGLLMFGKLRSILDECSNYILDYQDKSESNSEHRWIDRITTDFTWTGNIYDFYRKTYTKLVSDLKVPFKLEGNIRKDETPVHEAIRETLVNSLIHSDYYGSVSVQIIKYSDSFEFRNPGLMRIPAEEAKKGGNSDCRNRNLQKMFQFIGAGEQAGSGIPKIYQNWSQQHWRLPKISEKFEPEQTCFELKMENLLSPESLKLLLEIFGDSFKALSDFERLILVVAEAEKSVDHKSLKNISAEHPADISKYLNNLVKKGFLISSGRGRGTSYSINMSSPDKDLNSPDKDLNSPDKDLNSPDKDLNSPDKDLNSPVLEEDEKRITLRIKGKQRLHQEILEEIVVDLCSLRPQSIDKLAGLLDRNPKYVRETIIKNLLKIGKLNFLYPNEINHPRQAYIVKEEKD